MRKGVYKESRNERRAFRGPGLEKENTSTIERSTMTGEATMTPEELTTIQAEKIVDARGTSCPGPILAAKKGIPSVSVGGVMEVMATDTGTQKDLPAWCKKMGHEFLGTVEEPGFMKLYVRKMK
jgi:tRNA 2-thiouridine synthesizing protein A